VKRPPGVGRTLAEAENDGDRRAPSFAGRARLSADRGGSSGVARRVVIVGGGFGGFFCAKALKRAPLENCGS